MENLNLCMLQMDLAWQDPARNRALAEEMLAGQKGKHDLIVLPEMFNTGFSMEPAHLAESMEGETVVWMQKMATEMDSVLAGSLIIEENGNHYNRFVVVTGNGVATHYDKRHLFRMAGEHQVFTMGHRLQAFSLKGWRICPQVCYDLRFPVWTRNHVEADGRMWYDLVLYVANWPEARVSHWNALLKARAIENQAYCAGVNRVGEDGNGIVYSGDSAIVDYLGAEVDHAFRQARLLVTSLEWEPLRAYREKFPAWGDADAYELKS